MEGREPVIKILNAEPADYSRKAYAMLSSFGDVVEKQVDQIELMQCVHEFDVLIVRLGLKVDKQVLSKASRLKFILTATTGTDHIDVAEAQARQIEIVSLKGEIDFLNSIPSTAEHSWALLLSLTRNLPQAVNDVRLGHWDRQKFRGRNLRGKKLAILGLGRVGKQVAKFGLCFGMEVKSYDPFQMQWIDRVGRFETVEALLSWCDILSIHIPLDQSTLLFLDEEKLKQLKKGAYIINTSRAGIWDEEIIARLLVTQYVSGVATDVVVNEQQDALRKAGPLLSLLPSVNNLIITPHIAGATFESMEMTEIFIAEKFLYRINN